MTIPMEIVMWLVGALGTGIITGIGFILRMLSKQNVTLSTQGGALALLVARVGNINPEVIDKRLIDLETDMARVWGIYDAWRGPNTPKASERMADHYS